MIIFYLENCPHCKRAKAWIEELYNQNEDYRSIPLEWVEESQEAATIEGSSIILNHGFVKRQTTH